MLKYALVENAMAVGPNSCQETKTSTVSETNEKIENESMASTDRQDSRTVSSRYFLDSEENSVSQTVVTFYDISLPKDTVTGAYPVKSISETVTVKGVKATASKEVADQTTVRELSQQADKNKKHRRNPATAIGQRPIRWRYGAIAIIAIAIGLFLLFARIRR